MNNKILNCDRKKIDMKTFRANKGKVYSHFRHHKANDRQVELDKFNKNFKKKFGRFMSKAEAMIYKSSFNSGYKSGRKRRMEVEKLLIKQNDK